MQARKWLEVQRAFVASVQKWDNALHQNIDSLCKLFEEWDHDGDGAVTVLASDRGLHPHVHI